MVLIDAIYINNGGGKVLLDYLVENLLDSKNDFFFFLDARCKNDYQHIPTDKRLFVNSSIKERRNVYKNINKDFDKVLCFANVPPPIKLKSEVYTYFHNTLMIDPPRKYSLKKKTKLFAQYLILFMQKSNTTFWIVQTENIRKIVSKKLKVKKASIKIIPFFNIDQTTLDNNLKDTKNYLYVSSGAKHKNHMRLLEAWSSFRDTDSPVLHLTVGDEFSEVLQKIKELQSKGCRIINHGILDKTGIINLYNTSTFLVYPSLTESFGLPLVEAVTYNCKAITADLPYAYQVIKPSLTFDPYDTTSIKNAIIASQEKEVPDSTVKVHDEIKQLIETLK